MGKYSSSSRAQKSTRPKIHPAMRGLGCLTMAVVPLLSYGIAAELAKGPARGWRLPPEWFGTPQIPSFLYSSKYLVGIANALQSQQNLTANLILGSLIMVVLFGIMTIIFGFLYNMIAPSKYGPHDVPPPRVKTKKFTR
jgi:hypothetical protein